MAVLWFLGGVLATILIIFGILVIFNAGVAAGKKQDPKSQKSSDGEGVK